MSSLRLALKQSLAESGTMSSQQPEQELRLNEGRRRKPGRKRREPRLDQIKLGRDNSSKKAKKIRTRLKNNERDVTVHLKRRKHTSSSILSSSESDGSSSSGSDDNSDDDRSFSSDSSNSKSSASNSLGGSNDDSSSDGNASSDSSSDSSSGENNVAMDGVFDSEVSSENEDDTSSRRKFKKCKKANREANKIHQHWKKQRSKASVTSKKISKTLGKGNNNPKRQRSSTSSISSKGSKKSSWNRQQTTTVIPPSNETIVWLRGMSAGKQRRKIAAGMRVKVRFTTKGDERGKDGKVTHKMKWYGGFVKEVGKEGKKIRIKYDDGTSEIANFPDKDIVVDAEGNGCHRVLAHAFIPPPPPPTPPRSTTPIPSFSSKDTKTLGINSDPLQHSTNSDSGSISNELTQAQIEEKCENHQRLHTPPGLISSERYISSRQSPSDLKHSTLSESPMSVTHGRGTVSSSGVSGCSDSSGSSGSFDHSMSINRPSRETNLTSKSTISRKRSRSRSSSPLPPNLIPKLSSQVEENDVKSHKQRGGENRNNKRLSPNPLLTIKLSSLKAKKRLCETQHVPNSNLSESSDSDSPQPRLSKEKTETCFNDSRQRASISGDESDGYTNKQKHRTSSESTEEEKEWMGDDEGQGLNINKQLSRTDIKVSIGSIESSSNQKRNDTNTMSNHTKGSHHESDIDSYETFTGASFRIKPLDKANIDFQSESTAFSSYVKDRSIESKSREIEAMDNAIEYHSDSNNISPETSQSSSQYTSSGEFSPKVFLHPGKKKRQRETGSRSQSPTLPRKIEGVHSPKEKVTEIPIESIHSNTSLSKDLSFMSSSSTVQNSNSIIMTIQSEGGDGNNSSRLPKDSPNEGKVKLETDSETLTTPQTTNLSDGEDENSLKTKSKSNKSSEGNSDSDGKIPISSSRPGRRSAHNRRVPSRDDNSLEPNKNSSLKSTKQKGKRKHSRKTRKKGNGGGGGNSGDEDSHGDNWVKCDRCHKWRLLPSTVNMDKLPERWYCELNHYDSTYNNCEAPEQSIPEGDEEVSITKKLLISPRPNLNSTKKSKSKSSQRINDSDDVTKRSLQASSSPNSGCIRVDTNGLIEGMLTASVGSSDDYDSDDESSKNKFLVRRRSRLQDGNSSNEFNENTDSGVSDNLSVSKGSSKRNRGRKEVDHEKKSSRGKKKKEEESQEWVQCEKCHKWRKLPLHVEAKDLPDVWYCAMNTWDPRSASCAVAEDDIDGNERNLTIMGSGKGPLAGMNGNGSKLSYRSLIFGSGRRQNRPISERTRAAESLFSSNFFEENNEASHPPTVMYANSSAFFYRGMGSYKVNPESSSESFFDVMSQSGLWDDLYQGARSLQSTSYDKHSVIIDEVDSGMDGYNYVRSMKAMVYYALGTKVLEDHEVLFEAQSRDWEDHRWSHLRESCTVDMIKKFLDQLVDDGLVEALQEETDNVDQNIVRYRRAIFESHTPPENTTQEQNSRCMKIAKPWKNV